MNARLPSAPTIYLTYLAVIVLQAPAAALMHGHAVWGGMLLSQFGAIALPTALFVWWRGYDWRTLFPLRWPGLPGTLGVVIVTIGVAELTHVGVEFMKSHFHTPPLLEERLPELVAFATPTEALMKLVLVAILPAIIEEGFFRGFCQSALSRVHGARIGWLISAALFAAAHNSFHYLHLYLLLGLYLGYLRVRSRSLWWPMLAHAVNNGWTLLMPH